MKKLLLLLIIIAAVSCESIFPKMEFRVISNGNCEIGFIDNGGYSQWNGASQSFEREMAQDEYWCLSAQSTDGKGCTVEAYIGGDLIRKASSTGYGVASIDGTY